jgi:hypothetical protein
MTDGETMSEDQKRTSECHHGWRGTAPEDGERIVTPCPHCGCQSLFIGAGGHLTCTRVPSRGSDGCGNPSVADAVATLKRDRDELVEALRAANKLICDWANFWAYGLSQPKGARPTQSAHRTAEELGDRATKCVEVNSALLAKHAPSSVISDQSSRPSNPGGAA